MTTNPEYFQWKCTVPPSLALTPCKLPSPQALIRPPSTTTEITPRQFENALLRAIATWNRTRYVRLFVAGKNDDPQIIQTYAPIDTEGKTLAYSTLPCYGLPVFQKYDAREKWDLVEEKSQTNPSLWLVIAHELGHALGLDHLPEGNIMAPYYHQMATKPGKEDLQELQKRYNQRKETPMTPSLQKILLCLAAGVPAILECLAKSELLAEKAGQPSPLMEAANHIRALRAQLRAEIYGQEADPTQTDADNPNNPQP